MRWSKSRIGVAAIAVIGAAYGAAVALGAPPMIHRGRMQLRAELEQWERAQTDG